MNANIHQILQKYWGYTKFRPLQEDIILSVLKGNDTLALLPTGGGKSITFQVPAMAMEGLCVVITPLIALMKDQVTNLKKRNIKAAAIYTGMSFKEIKYILESSVFNEYKFLYISPERAATENFRNYFQQMKICLIAVDESHCISQWGYDFRPHYLKIAELRSYHPDVPILAVTATATPEVVKDIQEKLLFKKENVFQKSFARPNLSYEVYYEEDKHNRILKILQENPGSAIIYVRNRKKTKEIANFLLQNKIKADYYHAGLTPDERDKKQLAWTRNECRVIVATNAFGMGIDKPDVRLVIHIDLPDCIEAYFQEAGRAGRDEKDARCIMLYNLADIIQARKQLQQEFPPQEFIRKVYYLVGNYLQVPIGSGKDVTFDFIFSDFINTYNLPSIETYYALLILERLGLITLSDAYHSPSKLKINVSPAEIYRFQVENPKLEPLIKALLRSYGGLYTDFVKIDEQLLSKMLKTSPENVSKALGILDNIEICTYIPASDKPKLTFVEPRILEQDIWFNPEVYEKRLERATQRLEHMIKYVQTTAKCRSKILLEYFGEKNAPRCGVCDVCQNRNTVTLNKIEFDNIIEIIKPKLKVSPMHINDVYALFKSEDKPKVNEVLRWLFDNNKLKIDENNILHWH